MENILFAILSLIVGIVIGCGLFYAVLVNKTSKSMKNANKLILVCSFFTSVFSCFCSSIFTPPPLYKTIISYYAKYDNRKKKNR